MSVASAIRQRRSAFGLSLEEVARLTELPAPRLRAIEAGSAPPTTTELSVLADALACNAADLARSVSEDPRRSVARFRSAITTKIPSPADLRLLARASEAGHILASLRNRLQVNPTGPLLSLRTVSAPSPTVEAWQDGYRLGLSARERLDSSRLPLPSVQAFLEAQGVHVATVAFEDENVEAASLFEAGAAPVILLNRRAPRASYALALRAILAHELCHLLNDGGERSLPVVSLQTDSSTVEQRANGFAPSFIAPGNWVSLRAQDPGAMAIELAETWGLSFEGAAWHLKNLKLLLPTVAEQLARHARPVKHDFERPLHRTPPAQFGIEGEASPLALGLLSETAIIAAAEGVISRGRAEEILRLA